VRHNEDGDVYIAGDDLQEIKADIISMIKRDDENNE
jgi:hypothetical protein